MKQSREIKNTGGLALERKYFRSGFDLVIGIDEAGRGPLAGPVFAGAVALINSNARDRELRYLLENVGDSKKTGPSFRNILYRKISAHGNIARGSAAAGEKIIDRINILEASKLAMARAVEKLLRRLPAKIHPDKIICLIDGNFSINVPYRQRSIIRGDDKVFSISAASIIAKVERDRLMMRLDKIYPAYGFCRHKGYPVKEHLAALARCGLSPVHRKSFSPCALRARKDIIKSNNKYEIVE